MATRVPKTFSLTFTLKRSHFALLILTLVFDSWIICKKHRVFHKDWNSKEKKVVWRNSWVTREVAMPLLLLPGIAVEREIVRLNHLLKIKIKLKLEY